MKIESEKNRLPKGLSYALKTSILQKAFDDNKITTSTHLIYLKSEIFFDAHYWLPNDNIDYCRFYIRSGYVKSEDRQRAHKFIQNTVIPDFIKWANEILSLPDNSPKLFNQPYFKRNFTGTNS